MMPPTRLEQLGNFQDSIQSPEGLERLRALQYIQSALPSSQGLMGMPQVSAPVVAKQYGGEVGTGGFVGTTDDGVQIFDNTDEGVLNRSLHGGILEGWNQGGTPGTSGTTSVDAAGTAASGTTAPSVFNISTGQDQYGNTVGDLTGTQDYYDLNFAARDAGQDTFMYGDKLMQVDPGYLRGGDINPFISNRLPTGLQQEVTDDPSAFENPYNLNTIRRKNIVGIGDYKEPAYVPLEDFSRDVSGQYDSYYAANQAAKAAGSPTFMWGDKWAKTDPGLLPDYTGDPKPFYSNVVPDELRHLAGGPLSVHNLPPPNTYDTPTGHGFYGPFAKHGGQVISKQYGGEVGTGGLLEVLDDGTQVFSNTEEGMLNRSLHGGLLEGWNQQTGTTGATTSETTGAVASGTTDAPGTLASGTSAAPAVLPKTAVDSSFLSPVMDLESVQQKGGIYNASELRDAGIDLNRPSDAPETIIKKHEQPGLKYADPVTGKMPYDLYDPPPIHTFGQGYDLKNMDYFTANALALSEGADRFMYNDEYAAVDPGLLSNYDYSNLGTKPWRLSMRDDRTRAATYGHQYHPYGGYLMQADPKSPQAMKAKGYEQGHAGNWVYTGKTQAEKIKELMNQGIDMSNPWTRQMHGFKHGGQISDTAEGLASFGRYGDNILVHMNPEELSGLASLGEITYNPVTGLPEAFSLKGLFKGIRKLAPIALTIAAPHIFGVAGATGLTGALKIGAASAFGSGLGHLIAGAKPKDALKAGLMSGLLAGGGAYLGSMGSAAASGAGTGGTSLVGTAGKVGPGSMGAGGFGQATQSVGSSFLGAGTTSGIPSAMGSGGFGQAIGAGKSIPIASQFTTVANIDNVPSYGGTVKPQIQLAPKVNPQVYGGTPSVGDPMIARDITPVQNFAPQQITYAPDDYMNTNIPKETQVQGPPEAPKSTSVFAEGGLSKENLSRMGSEIYDKYSTPKGIAKLVGMDLMTPDYDIMYANEARAKEQALRDAGYTVETDFDKQTVIRDSQGVIMPRNLTPSMILKRALGQNPRTRMVARYGYGKAKQGGLVSLAHGGEFSGKVPGEGHGMEDNVYMPITEGDKQVGTLAVSPTEYVVDSYTMSALGNGNADEGAKIMDGVVKSVRKKAYGTVKQPNEIDGLEALKPIMERV